MLGGCATGATTGPYDEAMANSFFAALQSMAACCQKALTLRYVGSLFPALLSNWHTQIIRRDPFQYDFLTLARGFDPSGRLSIPWGAAGATKWVGSHWSVAGLFNAKLLAFSGLLNERIL